MKPKENYFFPFAETGPHLLGWRAASLFLGSLLLSLLLYVLIHFALKKPLSVGVYHDMIVAKLADFNDAAPPRILLLAGSNVRVSHSATELERLLKRPVTNGGLSADVSLDLLISTYEPSLKSGDVVYLPLEYSSYLVPDRSTKVDYSYIMSYDKRRLFTLPANETLRAVFNMDLADIGVALGENFLKMSRLKTQAGRSILNSNGDQIGYTSERALAFRENVKALSIKWPSAEGINSNRWSVAVLEAFLLRCKHKGIRVIGGLPTTPSDASLDTALVDSIRDIYIRNGQEFLILSNHSQYNRDEFYDTEYHLNSEAAIKHSQILSAAIEPLLNTRISPESN